MNGRSVIGKRCSCGARFEAQNVLNRKPARPVLAGIDQYVRSDLSQGSLEQDQVAILGASARALAKQVHRVVEGVQSVFESGEVGAELERLGVWTVSVRFGVRSQ